MATFIEAIVKLWDPKSNRGVITVKGQDFRITKQDLVSTKERVQTGQTIRVNVKNFRNWL